MTYSPQFSEFTHSVKDFDKNEAWSGEEDDEEGDEEGEIDEGEDEDSNEKEEDDDGMDVEIAEVGGGAADVCSFFSKQSCSVRRGWKAGNN